MSEKKRRDITLGEMQDEQLYAIALEKRKNGNVAKINGAEVEPVDIITFGSPCQDLSVAGKRGIRLGRGDGLHTDLHNGDCMEVMKSIPGGSVDLVLTDPPYGITGLEWDNEIDVITFFNSVARVLRRGGRLVCFCQEPFTSRLVTGAIGELRFNYKCAWIKNRPGNAKMAKTAMISVIEDILIFTEIGRCKQASSAIEAAQSFVESAGLRRIAKILMQTGKYKNTASAIKNVSKKCDRGDSDYYNFFCKSDLVLLDKEIGVPFDIGWYLAEAERDKQSRTPVFNLWEGGKSKRNGLAYSCPSKPVHPTQKPVGLLEDLIKTFSNPGAKVIDCFMGSGSTGIACVNTGRNFIGIELDNGYFDIANERIQRAMQDKEAHP